MVQTDVDPDSEQSSEITVSLPELDAAIPEIIVAIPEITPFSETGRPAFIESVVAYARDMQEVADVVRRRHGADQTSGIHMERTHEVLAMIMMRRDRRQAILTAVGGAMAGVAGSAVAAAMYEQINGNSNNAFIWMLVAFFTGAVAGGLLWFGFGGPSDV